MAELGAYICFIVVSIMTIVNPQKATSKRVAKLEAKNGKPFTQEELDKRYKTTRIICLVILIVSVALLGNCIIGGINMAKEAM